MQRPDEALEHLDQSVRLDRSYAAAHFNLDILWLDQGDRDRARALFERAAALDDKHVELR